MNRWATIDVRVLHRFLGESGARKKIEVKCAPKLVACDGRLSTPYGASAPLIARRAALEFDLLPRTMATKTSMQIVAEPGGGLRVNSNAKRSSTSGERLQGLPALSRSGSDANRDRSPP